MPDDNIKLLRPGSARPPAKRIHPDVLRRSAVVRAPPRSPFVAPSFPPLVEQAVKSAGVPTLAMDDAIASTFGWAAQDSIYTAFAEGTVFLGYSYLATLAQRAEYRVVTETIASEMTREWIEIKIASGDESKSDKKKQIEDKLDNLNAQHCFRKIAESDGFYGRGHLYLDTGRTEDPDELLTDIGNGRNQLSRVKIGTRTDQQKLLRLQPVEASWAYPTHYESIDPLKKDWYSPSTWYVMARQIHRSRFLTLIGREVPDILKPAYAFGGLSMSQMLKPYVDNWLRTRQSVSDLIQNFSHVVLHTNLDATTAIGGEELFARVALFNNIKTNQGTVVIDKEAEDLSNISVPLGGLDHLQAQAQEHMAAIARIPLVKLLGIQPAGLNASSEGELIAFEDWITAFQNVLFRPALRTIIDFIQLSIWGEIDDDITFDFKPLRQMKPIEVAQLEATKAQTREIYVQTGAVDANEVREVLAQDPDAPFDGVDLDKPLPMPPGGEMGGMFGGTPGGGGPEEGGPPAPPSPGAPHPPAGGGGGNQFAPFHADGYGDPYADPASYDAGYQYGYDARPAAESDIAADQAVTAYHGTRTAALQSIIDNGLLSHPFKHYHPHSFYKGERGASVYVTENPEIAKRWALSEVDDPADVTILQLELPRDRLKIDEAAPEAERFLGDIPPAWIKSAYPLQRDGTFGAAIPLHAQANDDSPPGTVRYTVLHHDTQLGTVQQDAYDADALGELLGEDADPEWDESKVKRSKGGQFAKSAAPKESKESEATHISHPHVSAWVKKFGFSGKKHAISFAGPGGSEIKIHPPKKEGQKWTTVWSHHDKEGNETASGPTIGSLTNFLHANYAPVVEIGGGQTGGAGKAKQPAATPTEKPLAAPPSPAPTETEEQPEPVPPEQFKLQGHVGDLKSYAGPHGYTVDVYSDGGWYLTRSGEKVANGTSQEELTEALAKHVETYQKAAPLPHGPQAFPEHDLAPPHGFELSDKNADGAAYKDAHGNELNVFADGYWNLYEKSGGVSVGSSNKNGPSQSDIDKAVTALYTKQGHTLPTAAPAPTEAAATHGEKPYPDHDLAPPAHMTQVYKSQKLHSYSDPAGHVLSIMKDGNWFIKGSADASKPLAQGTTQAELDAAIAEHFTAPTEAAAPTEPTVGDITLPKGTSELLPHVTKYAAIGQTFFADAKDSSDATEQVIVHDTGDWKIWKKGEGIVATGVGEADLNHAFEQLHPRDEHGHFIKKEDQSAAATAAPTETEAAGAAKPSGVDDAPHSQLSAMGYAPKGVAPWGQGVHVYAKPDGSVLLTKADKGIFQLSDVVLNPKSPDGEAVLENLSTMVGAPPKIGAPGAGFTTEQAPDGTIKVVPEAGATAAPAATPTSPETHGPAPYGGNLAPPNQWGAPYAQTGTAWSYQVGNDYLDIYPDGTWSLAGQQETKNGTTQAALNAATTEALGAATAPPAAPATAPAGHGPKPYPDHDLAPPAGWGAPIEVGGFAHTYQAPNGDKLFIYSDGEWQIDPTSYSVDVINGKTQAELDETSVKSVGAPAAAEPGGGAPATPTALTHNAPAFPGQPAPPKGFDTLDSETKDGKTYTDAHGNSLAIFKDGYWALYGPGMALSASSGKSGTGQSNIDKAVADLLAKQGHALPTAPTGAAPTAAPAFPEGNLSPPSGWTPTYEGATIKTYGGPGGTLLDIYKDGQWTLATANKTVDGKTQAELDAAVSQYVGYTGAAPTGPLTPPPAVQSVMPHQTALSNGDTMYHSTNANAYVTIAPDGGWALKQPGEPLQMGTGQQALNEAFANAYPAASAGTAQIPTPPPAAPAPIPTADPDKIESAWAPPLSKKALLAQGFIPNGMSTWTQPGSGIIVNAHSNGAWSLKKDGKWITGGKKLAQLKPALAKHAPKLSPQQIQQQTAATQATQQAAATQATAPATPPADIAEVLPHKKEFGNGDTLYHDSENLNDATEQVTFKPDGSWSIWQKDGTLLEGKGQASFNQAFESLHPRDEHGHFIKKDKGEAAPAGPAKSTEVSKYTASSPLPPPLNGVAFNHWTPPTDWSQVEGTKPDLVEPPINPKPNQHVSSGVLIQEPDGRVWLMQPKDKFGNTEYTFPKGQQESGLSLQQNAIKEGFEESGLKVEITGFAGDYEGETSITRYYFAKRTGGTPTGYAPSETQEVTLVPAEQLKQFLNKPRDHKIADAHFGTGATKPQPAAAAIPGVSASTVLNLAQMKQVGKQLGSNKGGQYEAPDGTKYYVKQLQSDGHVNNEMLAAALYRAAGGKTFEYSKVIDGGKLALATKWQQLKADNINQLSAAQKKAAQQDFAIQAWIGNWDAAGIDNSNIGVTQNGDVIPLDLGGSLLYRAKGEAKTAAQFAPTAPEWESLRDPSTNPQTAALYGGMTKAELEQSAAKLKTVSDATIDQLVKQYTSDPQKQAQLAQTLKARRDAIVKKALPPPAPQATGLTPQSAGAVRSALAKHAKPRTGQVQQAIYDYKGSGYDAMNACARFIDDCDDPRVLAIDKHLANTSLPATKIYRGIPYDKTYVKKVKALMKDGFAKGKKEISLPDAGFGSTSTYREFSSVWRDRSTEGKRTDGLLFEIEAPEGFKGEVVEPTGSDSEYEVLLPRGCRYIATSFDPATGVVKCRLDQSKIETGGP